VGKGRSRKLEQKKAKGTAENRARAAERALEHVDKEVADELRQELDDAELDLDKIVAKAYVIEGKREGWQYRVRFVGYGAKDDEWYCEEDLTKTASQEMGKGEEAEERGRETEEGWGGDHKVCKCRAKTVRMKKMPIEVERNAIE
jgi:hypothetical protein